MSSKVVILGGGLAGLACAMRLIEHGCEVTVLESRRRLGGRASSFDDARSGRTLDNCQHVLMGCCTNLLDLYARLGVEDAITWHDTMHWLVPGGGIDIMRPSRLPAPLHLARALSRMRLLDRGARLGIARAAWRMLRIGANGRRAWAGRTFGAFLDEMGQREEVRRLFWEPIIVSACNLAIDEVAAEHGMQVFQESFMAGRWHATMGVPRIPLGELYGSAVEAIQTAGGEVHLGCAAGELGIEGRRVIGVETPRGFMRADSVVSALPWEKLLGIVPASARGLDARLEGLERLGHSPILGVHLIYDRPVMELGHLVLPGRDVQWIFNKGVDERGEQHLHGVISAADAWMARDEEEITRTVQVDVRAAMPAARDAVLVLARPVKERRATFRATPEAQLVRPCSAPSPVGLGGGDLEGLYLAGDWCSTGWPATMEGAVRSGYLAARAVTGVGGLIGDAPPGRLVRALARGVRLRRTEQERR